MRKPPRPSSPAWASCTWTSLSTACAASSASRPTPASRRWPIARPSAIPARSRASSSARPAGTASMATAGSASRPPTRGRRGRRSATRAAAPRNPGETGGRSARQPGGHGQYGHCWIRFAPADEGQEGLQFSNEIVGGAIPREYIPAIQKGIEEQMKNGVLAGYPLLGLKAAVFDGSTHDVDSSELAYKIAASMATKQLSPQGGAGP